MPDVYLGLGSNLGDRQANILEVVRRVGDLPGTRIVARSDLYETEPVGPISQDWFVNAVLRIETGLDPHSLLRSVKSIEGAMGRLPAGRWGPRVVDVDILFYDDVELTDHELTIPHPGLWDRRFVLVPLLDVLNDGALRDRVRRRLQEPFDPHGVRMLGDCL